MPQIHFTSALKRFYPALSAQQFPPGTVQELVSHLGKLYPGLPDYLIDEQGQLREHVNIFIDNEHIKDPLTLQDWVEDQQEVYIMQALSGG